MKFKLLNHASLIIELGSVKLLTDPWFFGTCFEGGWGQKYNNPECLEAAKDCTHLWISHFHTDHFHFPTLKELVKVNKNIIILGNHSFNFQLDNAVKRAGFKNIVSLGERKKLKLSDDVDITRFPATGIDNMLLIRYKDFQILNYNDCNLPARARKSLAKKMGKTDILLNNYNHAGKLLDFPLPSSDKIKEDLKQNFVESSESFHPQYIIPFASHHYYKAKESQDQNESLMEIDELLPLDKRVLPFGIGETIVFDDKLNITRIPASAEIKKNPVEIIERKRKYTLEELNEAFAKYSRRMRKAFLDITFWIPDLIIKIEDLDTIVSLNLKKGLRQLDNNTEHHITATSEALFIWFDKLYGIDSFWVGAHFDINQETIFPLRWQLLVGLLTENKLDLRSMIRMVFTPEGIKFLYNRREEITAVLLSTNFKVGSRK